MIAVCFGFCYLYCLFTCLFVRFAACLLLVFCYFDVV